MNASVSGMTAQATALGSIGENISNSSTVGYKSSLTSFSSLVSGGVSTTTKTTQMVDGDYTSSSVKTNLAVKGDGYFIVENANGDTFLTREGDFSPNADGYLQNASGYLLLGYSYANGDPAAVTNGFQGLEPVKVSSSTLSATATTTATVDTGNLNSSATAVTGDTPSSNNADANYTYKSSVVAYDSLGNALTYDVYYTKTDANTWEVAVYNKADATDQTSFPYGGDGMLGSATLTFDSTTGKLDSSSDTSLDVSDNNNNLNFKLDLAAMTQLSSTSAVTTTANGSAAESSSDYTIGTDGTISQTYADGSSTNLYKIALANVASPNNLEKADGTAYKLTQESGTVVVGFAGTGSFGTIQSSTLEASNVDLASQLSNMIQAQRTYSANSKVLQTAADMLDTVINVVR
ncbi:flagellar hook protein FlgE [Allorhizobium sonneratiae]|uniref:flagellar hook protein FlgE n=1 Tax=Allorhizobium sonneratiae TaxID=2934936 RepID=UPI00237CBE66|nr:flagellar hook protein FlgE [Allorhizobium sonneratiae]